MFAGRSVERPAFLRRDISLSSAIIMWMSISEKLRKKAAEIGFADIGFARAEPLAAERKRLAEWLADGYAADMAWMYRDPDKRSDPKLIFPEAKTVVTGAVNYYTPYEHHNQSSSGKISRYAWGDDYHDVVKQKFTELFEWLRSEMPDVNGKICVDTTPIMDKAWAVRGGLGWIGKHSNVITRGHGSWVFLGELLLDVAVDKYDEPVGDHCGSCTACIDACPTSAIIQPYVIDSARCISYATIEYRGETLSETVTDKLDGWIYGCDVCQDVCPWNRFEKPSDEPHFQPRNHETSLDLTSIAEMEHDEYVERFRRSPMKRAKLVGLKRNAAALKKQKTEE